MSELDKLLKNIKKDIEVNNLGDIKIARVPNAKTAEDYYKGINAMYEGIHAGNFIEMDTSQL